MTYDSLADPSAAEATAARLDGVLRSSVYVTAIVDDVGTILWVSENLPDVFGYETHELTGTSMLDYMDLEWNQFALHSIGFALENPGQRLPMLFRFIDRDGTPIITEVTANNQFANPAVGGLVVNVRRWDERVLLDRVLDALAGGEPLEEVFAVLVGVMACETLESVGSVLWEVGPAGFDEVVAAPSLPVALAGGSGSLPADEYAASPWGLTARTGQPQVVPVDELPAGLRSAAVGAGFGCCWTWPVGVRGEHGVQACLVLWRREPVEPEPSCELIVDRLIRLTGLALERAWADARLRHAARHDALTGLANRARFFDELDAALAGAPGRGRAGEPLGALVGVLYVDLDGFKPINDTHGHRIGDLVLQAIADRLGGAVRPGDVVARLGGDEFAIVCAGMRDAGEIEAIAERLVSRLGTPVVADGVTLEVGASVGAALAPAGSITSDALVDAADRALYGVKAAGKNGWRLAPSS